MKAAEHHNGSQTENTTPTISGYYSDGKLKPAQFFKLVQASQIKVFRSDDVELALNNLTERDKDLTRTMSLASAAKVPEAVELWVAEAARMSIRSVVPEIAIEDSAEANFKRLTRELASDLRGKDKPKRRRAENLIRLALIWLIGRRSLDPMSAWKALSEAKGTMSTPKVLRSNAQKLLMRSYTASITA